MDYAKVTIEICRDGVAETTSRIGHITTSELWLGTSEDAAVGLATALAFEALGAANERQSHHFWYELLNNLGDSPVGGRWCDAICERLRSQRSALSSGDEFARIMLELGREFANG